MTCPECGAKAGSRGLFAITASLLSKSTATEIVAEEVCSACLRGVFSNTLFPHIEDIVSLEIKKAH